MNDNNNGNFFLAIMLCLGVLLAWQYFIIDPKIAQDNARRQAMLAEQAETEALASTPTYIDAPGVEVDGADDKEFQPAQAQAQNFANSPRLAIETPQLTGSIALMGARIDDLSLKQYPVSLGSSDIITLLAPETDGKFWHVTYGWIGRGDINASLPAPDSLWQIESGDKLTPETPVTLRFDANNGLIFRRHISIDDNFMFTVRQSIENSGAEEVTLFPYGQITRRGKGTEMEIFVLHEGGVGVLGEEKGLQEIDYSDLVDDAPVKENAVGGWLGLTDKYWAAAIIPPQNEEYQARMSGEAATGAAGALYRTDFRLGGRAIKPGTTVDAESRLFAGAKKVDLIDAYNEAGILKFDLLIDWGWFYFLTKPMFQLLAFFYGLIGNYGLAILIVTVVIKLVFFPLANKSYVTMAKMKKLQPEMTRIRETLADDKQQQQQELLKLYREEKLNPMAGCLPILIQVPVFFSLYKVLYVTIDMRHQPFFGWIQDLSVPDPTSLFNLFGLLPYDPPQFLMLGIWPIIMGITMFIQMQMNPPAPDPVQRRIFMFMPLLFTFLLASFPAGLVIYWAWNNALSVLQQGYIMQRNGAPIELLNNLGLKKKSGS